MKILSVLVLLSLMLSSCSVYKGHNIVEQYPAKYEYRCVDSVCKDININYKYEYIPKDKYKNLSEEELKDKQKKSNNIGGMVLGSIYFGVIGAVGVNTAINTGGSGAFAGVGWGVLASMGAIAVIGFIILMLPTCYLVKEEEKFYYKNCYTIPAKSNE